MATPKRVHSSATQPRNARGQFASTERGGSARVSASAVGSTKSRRTPVVVEQVEEDVKPNLKSLVRQTRSMSRGAGLSTKPSQSSSRGGTSNNSNKKQEINTNQGEYYDDSDVNSVDDAMSEGEHRYDGYESLEEEEQQMMVELREKFDITEKKICRDIDDDPEKSKQNLKKNLNRLYNSTVCVRLMPKYVKKEASKKKR
ncbi:uncharacterized protein [Miscanthus floridulus]|uniref:uncharacterized protein n=1 Tax=Miscanthus floridulus TaxID=154761 RepID=UPI00345AD6A6